MSTFPPLGVVQVISRSSNPYGVYVLHPSIQATGVLVRPLMYGSADALRVSQKALPTEGTWGIVAWPHGDSRNGVWLGSIYTQGNDAILPGSPDVDYEAHPSGAYTLLDQNGNFTFSFPDGSSLQMGATGGAPELTRHVVNSAQFPQAISYPNSSRVSAVPSAFPAELKMASGTSVTIDTSGNTTVAINSGGSFKVTANGTLFEVDGSGNVSISLASGAHFNIGNGGSASDHITIAELITTWLVNHTHNTPSGVSSAPIQTLTESMIASNLMGVQS